MSILSVLREKDDEFKTMIEIFRKEGTSNAKYLESIVKPLEEAGLLSCNYVEDRCNVTVEGIRVFERFYNAARSLDTVLKHISSLRGSNVLGMKAINEKYVIPESMERLRDYGVLYRPFIPEGGINPFIKAFIIANGNPSYFISQIVSFYHPFAFLLIAKHITEYETRYETYALTCKSIYGYPIGKETKEILEILSNEDRHPTGEGIKEILRDYTEKLRKYGISVLKSPLQSFVAFRLIKNLKEKGFCTCGVFKHYKDDRYVLTNYGRNLAKYIALHILLS